VVQIGFNAGDGVNYHSVEGAQTDAVINLTLTSNVNVPGKWMFGVSSVEIRDVKCSHDGECSRLMFRVYCDLIMINCLETGF